MKDATNDFGHIRSTIRAAYLRIGNWRKVAAEFGITPALAYRIVENGYEPKKPTIRHRLGLPVVIPTAACPVCGQVHTLDGVCVQKSAVTVVVDQSAGPKPMVIVYRKARPQRPAQRLSDLPVKVLRWQLEHREELS